jgi:hypothetical protein
MLVQKIETNLDLDLINKELECLPKFKGSQIMLQTVDMPNHLSIDPLYGTGRITEIEHNEPDFINPIWPTPYLNDIINRHDMIRTRVMTMKPKLAYRMHRDYSMRYHIPLITNENCFFIIDENIIRLPADGSLYLVDTNYPHTFVNASGELRTHIVGVQRANY